MRINDDTEVVRDALIRHRLEGYAAALCLSPEAPDVPEALQDTLRQRYQRRAIIALRQASVTQRANQILTAAGISALFIKGLCQSAQSTGDWLARGTGDIDLLVAPENHNAAVTQLLGTSAESVERPTQSDTWVSERIATVHHATTLRMHDTTLDIHRRLDPNPRLMHKPFVELWRNRDAVNFGGAELPTLDPLDAAVFVASHGCQDNWGQLRAVVDFVLASQEAGKGGSDVLITAAEAQGVPNRMRIALQMTRLLTDAAPDQGARARLMAQWAWSRHRAGRLTRNSPEPRDAVGTFAYWIASEGGSVSYDYGLRRLTWLPSVEHGSSTVGRWAWTETARAPLNATRRLQSRRKSGRAHG